ncbi:hypothetical protein [Undibacterium sp.]|uniref:hypothetical protein n=1 Tax=Undibacterium sp. TaxID=1914977 RepID=UPI00374D7E3C
MKTHYPTSFRHTVSLSSLLLLCGLAFAPAVHAQSAAQPKPTTDDSWSYNTVDLGSARIVSEVSLKTVGIEDKYVHMFVESKTNNGDGELEMPKAFETTDNADMNSVLSFRGERQEKILYKWPLEPGKKWSFQLRQEVPGIDQPGEPSASEMQVITNRFDAEVKGWETVDTPAGRFKAIKTVYKNNWALDSKLASGLVVITSWYSPQVKREVLSISETFTPDGQAQSRTRQQLLSYQVNKPGQ